MADWIPWVKGLPQKAEIIRIASRLSVTQNEAAVQCMVVWGWADEQTVDGFIAGIRAADVSNSLRLPGIGEAMVEVGWIVEERAGITFPKWDRYNTNSAKQRMQAAVRQENRRRKCHGAA